MEIRYDDNDSYRGLSISSSSTHSREIRKQKSSTFLAKLRPQPSKQHMRSESADDSEPHPSLRPPIPPLPPPQYKNSLLNLSTPTIVSIPSTIKTKRSMVLKKASHSKPPPPPPKDDPFKDFKFEAGIIDISLDEVEGFVDLSRPSVAGERGLRETDVQLTFSDPFLSGPSSPDRPQWQVPRKTSNPIPPDSAGLTSGSDHASASNWHVPPSWSVVQKPSDDQIGPEVHDASESEDDAAAADDQIFEGHPVRKPSVAPVASVSPARESRGTLGNLSVQPEYRVILYLPSGREHAAQIGPETTVASLTARVLKEIEHERIVKGDVIQKADTLDDCIQLYLKEQMRGTIFLPNNFCLVPNSRTQSECWAQMRNPQRSLNCEWNRLATPSRMERI